MGSHLIDSTRALSLAAVLGFAAATSAVAQENTVVGDWEGAIDAGGQMIDMMFHITADEDGTLSATLDVPTQGLFGTPVEDVSLVDGVFTFGLSGAPGGAAYEAKLSEDGSSMEGTWTQGPNSLELNMTRAEG